MPQGDRRAGLAVDAGFGVVFGVLLVAAAVAIGVSWGGLYWLFDAVAGLVVCAIALSRRHGLVRAAAAGLAVAAVAVLVSWAADLPQEPGPAMAMALAVLIGSAVRMLPPRSAAGVAAGGLAVVAGTWLAASTAVTTWNSLAWLGALAAGLCGRLLDARRRATAEQVRREERLQLARELHDVAAHHLTGLVLHTQAAQLTAHKHPDRVAGSLAEVEAAGSDALGAIRRVVGLLRDGDDDSDDTVPATPGFEQLDELVRRFRTRGERPAVHLRVPDNHPVWPPEVTSTLYRIVQEALTNVARHAPGARSVTVVIGRGREAATVEITDDAPRPPARCHRGGYGLIGMRERVEALGGTLHAGACEDAGWSVRATLPVPADGAR